MTGYWAADGRISRAAIEGGIEIAAQQYDEALAAMLAGREVTIDGGFAIRDRSPGEGYTWEDGAWVAPPAPDPEPEPVTSVTRRQIMTGLAIVGWITEQEALDALATGARPAAVETVIGALPEDQRFAARMKWIGFQTAYRDDAMVSALGAAAGKTEQDVDDFFAFCATID